MSKRPGTARTTRLRKAECLECGYIIRVSRSCMSQGLPSCHCGAGPLRPSDIVDLVELGYVRLDDLARPVRTELCRENGWEDEIVRTSPGRGKFNGGSFSQRKAREKAKPVGPVSTTGAEMAF